MTEKYSVSWNSPSRDSSESMPLGGCSMGCNVWVEKDQLMIYLAESGAFDENGTLLKLGRIRISAPEIDFSKDFLQTLYPDQGCMIIQADGVKFTLWCDISQSALNMKIQGKEIRPQLYFDCWRYRDRPVGKEEKWQCRDWDIFGDTATRKDQVKMEDGELLFWHENQSPNVFDLLIKQQKLESIRHLYRDVVTGRSFGGLILAPGFLADGEFLWEYAGTDCKTYQMTGKEERAEWTIRVTVYSSQTKNWKEELYQRAAAPDAYEAVRKWWTQRFEECFIEIDPGNEESEGWKIARNYTLFRHQQLCNAGGEFPTKFNGGLFTFDAGFTPDFRGWGGTTFTAQNQRLVYWPMLKNGDFPAMLTEFEFYRKITDAQKALTEMACGHKGAFFDEQITVFGMSSAAEYERPGKGRREEIPVWDLDNPWVRLHFSEALEFALMILEYEEYTQASIAPYLEFIDSIVTFYFEHYKIVDGKLKIFPASALETFKGKDPHAADAEEYGASNPADVIAGLQAVLYMLIRRGGEGKEKYQQMLSQCPKIPLGSRNGKEVWMPAEEYQDPPFNCELPQLCRVFPYSPEGLTKEEIRLGIDTLHHSIQIEDQASHTSWHQNGIFMARLGLAEEAREYLIKKLGNAERRFPTFWGPGHDWMPDHNWGGSGAIQLQEMLLRTDKDEIQIFPCWPRQWNAHFKLFAPGGLSVEAEIKDGNARLIEIKKDSTWKQK